MKKLTNNITLVSFVMGILLFLNSFDMFDAGGGYVAVGIFAFLCGGALILAGIFDIIPSNSKGLGKVKSILSLGAYPLYMFIYTLINIIVGIKTVIEYDGKWGPSTLDWIFMSLILTVTLVALCFVIISNCSNNKVINTIAKFSLLALLGLEVVYIIMSTGTIGALPLVDSILLICFFFITKPFVDLQIE